MKSVWNEWKIVEYGKKSVSGEGESTPNATTFNFSTKSYEKMYVWVTFASAFPSYSNRSPKLNMSMYLWPSDLAKYRDISDTSYIKVTALPTLTFGNAPYTKTGWIFDVSAYNIGDITFKYWLSSGAATVATTRATYGITAIYK